MYLGSTLLVRFDTWPQCLTSEVIQDLISRIFWSKQLENTQFFETNRAHRIKHGILYPVTVTPALLLISLYLHKLYHKRCFSTRYVLFYESFNSCSLKCWYDKRSLNYLQQFPIKVPHITIINVLHKLELNS